jgi:Flp pilus assembly pilin Flp
VIYTKIRSLLCNEKGQTLAEYSLVAGISSAISSSIAAISEHWVVGTAFLAALLIFLVFRKSKNLMTVILILLLLSATFILYRWIKYDSILPF